MSPEKRAHEEIREGLSRAGTPDGYGSFGRAMARAGEAPLREGNRLTLLRDAPETYEEWLSAIAGAERRVHLENYIFRADRVGHRFAGALAERAAAGVRVRVLVDWFGCANVPRAFWERLRRAGVEVRLVNPPDLAAPLEGFRRDHRKLLTVDGSYGSTGGVCIAEDWLKSSPESGLTYRDTAVGVRGPAVADLERAFATAWEAAGGPLPLAECRREATPAGDEAARVVAQEPGRTRMLRVLELLCAGVERRLWITDAYFLSMPILTEALKAAARDGVDVRLLLPATNDLPLIGAVSRTGYRDLLESGVGIWEYGGPMIHAKTTVADGWWSRIGSTNLNVSSLLANWEVDLVVEDRRFAARMEEMFEGDLANAREVRLGGPRRRPSPERSISRSERRRRRGGPESGARAAATVRRVGGTALRESADPLRSHERAVAATVGGVLIGLSLLGARFPRALAWPLAAVGGLLGTSFLLSAAKPSDPPR